MTRELDRRLADADHAVVTVAGGGSKHRARPCRECPWRRENVGAFPAEAFRISATTAYDMADRTFACHMAGIEQPRTCAGGLLSTGAEHNLNVRLRLMRGEFRWEDVTDGGADLFPDYRAMSEANGVDPDDEVLAPCR
jgi:hypothetical protein